jgi:site-specific recombinase XerD
MDGLGTLDASKVGYRDDVEWVQSMHAKGLSAKTIADVHGLPSAAFNTMVKMKKRDDNPCKGVSLPKSDATEAVVTFLTRDEWARLIPFINEPHRALFEFLALTGLRFSEATALYARDFETDSRGRTTVKITRAWTSDENNSPYLGPPKTFQSRRTVVVQRDLEQRIRPLLRQSAKTGGQVFLNKHGSRMDHRAAWHAWERAIVRATAAGVTERRVRIHDLRHSNASWLLQAGLDMFKLQKHLGHKSITTTINRYSHLLPEAYDDAAAAMDKAFGG